MAEAAPPPAAPPTGAQPGTFIDPYRAYNFKLLIQGVTEGHFTECSGMNIKVHNIKYREGGNAGVTHQLPGPVEYGDVQLRYGLTDSTELWTWFLTAVQGTVSRRNVSILLLDSDGVTEKIRWNLINAWPSHWRGTPLDGMGREAAIETMTLVFETLERG